MIAGCIKQGLQSIRRQSRLFLLLWLGTLLLGLVVAWPAAQWWNRALGHAPEADRLLEGFSFQILKELTAYDQNSPWPVVIEGSGMVFLLALLAGPFISGGIFEIIITEERGRVLSRFLNGAGRYFWRFLRLALIGGMVLFLFTVLFLFPTVPLLSWMNQAGWEVAVIMGGLAQAALLALMLGCLGVVLDYARVQIVTSRSNRTLQVFRSALHFVFMQAPGSLLIAVFFILLVGCAGLAGLLIPALWPGNTWPLILVLLLIQQAVLLLRCALRVGALNAHLRYYQNVKSRCDRFLPPIGNPILSTESLTAMAHVDNR